MVDLSCVHTARFTSYREIPTGDHLHDRWLADELCGPRNFASLGIECATLIPCESTREGTRASLLAVSKYATFLSLKSISAILHHPRICRQAFWMLRRGKPRWPVRQASESHAL